MCVARAAGPCPVSLPLGRHDYPPGARTQRPSGEEDELPGDVLDRWVIFYFKFSPCVNVVVVVCLCVF